MNIPAKKSLGQNFLKDEKILQRIANIISITNQDLVIEIGPGKGALTKYLVQKNCNYLAYEIDERMKSVLSSYPISIIWKDFLTCNLKEDIQPFSYENIYVVANIPYYITTPILEHIISSSLDVKEMVLLVQKEVAERFCAKPHTKDFGYFTVYLKFFFDVSLEFEVSRLAFQPVPKVDSAVVHFKKKTKIDMDTKGYFHFLKKCFSNKRKTLRNNLKDYDWNRIVSVLEKHQYTEMVRAEEISEDVFLELYENL